MRYTVNCFYGKEAEDLFSLLANIMNGKEKLLFTDRKNNKVVIATEKIVS